MPKKQCLGTLKAACWIQEYSMPANETESTWGVFYPFRVKAYRMIFDPQYSSRAVWF